jgi:hypothetical protein
MQIAKGVPAAAAAIASIADELTDHDLETVVGGLARALVDEAVRAAVHATPAPQPLAALGQADVQLEPSPA